MHQPPLKTSLSHMKYSPPHRHCPRNPEISQRYNSCRLTVHPRASIYPFHTARSPSHHRWPWSPGTFRHYNVCKMIRMRSPELWKTCQRHSLSTQMLPHLLQKCLPRKWSRPMSSCLGRIGPGGSPDTSTQRSRQSPLRNCPLGKDQSTPMSRARRKICLAHRMHRLTRQSHQKWHFVCPLHTEHKHLVRTPTGHQSASLQRTTCRWRPLVRC